MGVWWAGIGHFLPFYTGVCSPCSWVDKNAYPGSLGMFLHTMTPLLFLSIQDGMTGGGHAKSQIFVWGSPDF